MPIKPIHFVMAAHALVGVAWVAIVLHMLGGYR